MQILLDRVFTFIYDPKYLSEEQKIDGLLKLMRLMKLSALDVVTMLVLHLRRPTPQLLAVRDTPHLKSGHLYQPSAPYPSATQAVFLGTPRPVGYGFSELGIWSLWHHHPSAETRVFFEAESRLWACYIVVALYICGFVLLGASLEKHLSVGAVIMRWGIVTAAIMINTVAIFAYCNDCFPGHQGEISALINLARTLGGFVVAYFQVPWAFRSGALQTFGVEAAIIVALFIVIIPVLQYHGGYLRTRYSI